MTSQPEKIFHEKFENFQRPAPAAAWERIEANLDKKTRKKGWIKIAAAILILMVGGFLLWPGNPVPDSTLTESNPPPLKNKETSKPVIQEQKSVSNTTVPVQQKKKKAEKNNLPAAAQGQSLPVATSTVPEKSLSIESIPLKTTSTADVVAEVSTTQVASSNKIVYSAEEVNARFLKKNASAQATPDDKKSSGIQKLMGLAQDLKNNENGFGDLRQKKDEILALNFLNNNEDKTEKSKN